MMKMLTPLAACLLLLPLQAVQGSAVDETVRAPKAIFIIVDGIPADVLEATDTPNLDDIAGDHGYTRSYGWRRNRGTIRESDHFGSRLHEPDNRYVGEQAQRVRQ